VNVTIKDIRFERPKTGAILLAATTGVEISGNMFFDAILEDVEEWSHWPHAAAIEGVTPEALYYDGWFDPSVDGTALYPRIVGTDPRTSTAVKGTILITDNHFDGNARPDPDGVSSLYYAGVDETWQGMSHAMFFWFFDADVVVSGNTIENVLGVGMGFGGYFGHLTIQDNCVRTGGNTFSGNGISANEEGYGTTLFGKTVGEGDRDLATTVISGNRVAAGSEYSGYGEGINALFGRGVVASGNSVSVDDPLHVAVTVASTLDSLVLDNDIWLDTGMGVAVWDWGGFGSTGNIVLENTIKGVSDIGIWVGDFPPYDSSDGNTISGNEMRALALVPGYYGVAAHAAFLPLSADNVFAGHKHDLVIDMGTNNEILGKKLSRELSKQMKKEYWHLR
jgi:hypothetical protein